MEPSSSDEQEKSRHTPCSCEDQSEPPKLVVGRLLMNLGGFLADVGQLLAEEVRQSVAKDPLEGHELPAGYTACKCPKDDCCERSTDKDGLYLCKDTKEKKCDKASDNEHQLCDCHLFRFKKDPEKNNPWEHRADPGESDSAPPDNAKYFYKCICVSTKK